MNITLRQIRAFIAIADLGRFNLAANKLSLTQSAVSILIRELEAEMGVTLFDRHTRMVSLTSIGKDFLPQARKAVEDLEMATRNVRDSAALKHGKVAIAASIVLAATIVPVLMARFLKQHPGVTVQLHDMAEERIRTALKSGQVDMAIGTLPDDEPEIKATPVISDRLMVTCRADHRFAQMKHVRWQDLEKERLIVLAAENPLREIVDRAMLRVSPSFRPSYEVRFSTTAISLISEGLGISVLPENARQLASAVHVRTIELIEPRVTREISVLQHRQRSLPPAAQKFKELILRDAVAVHAAD
ncbi:LysR substrate-binding domain-containing protein [Xinfangfangia sp. CPCC 101601]|uniref:LysR substrate-binding domain-containing protein n=1 Tax=Pseudogemmobacter lacusdianii TaxID=3069608 RepID=A0ABU0W1P9_9RHOB|nr:LysR family transcriptional regulator [Xinfangfangia sp. CPCC 101601]MDQ2067896.1 LysR substrate-binding domain-containing protein [Xinfangfangia sp. CPCC 101601]